MTKNPRKGLTLEYLIDKRARILTDLRSEGHHDETETLAYGNHDPFDVPPAICDHCRVPPTLERIQGRDVRWHVTCHRCGKSIREHRKRPWLALLAWNAINLASQDYRDLPLFGLHSMTTEDARLRMLGIRRDLELRTRLAGIERTVAKRTCGTLPGKRYRLRLETYLQWAMLALRLIKCAEDADESV